MKGIFRYIFIAAAAMLTSVACNKSLEDDNQPKHLILLNAVEEGSNRALNKGTFSETKALLDGNTFMTEGNQIVVYDYYTAPEDVQNPNPATEYYIPGATAESTGETATGTVWPFINATDPAAAAPRYEWTEAGTHKFFGWMVKDNNENPALTAQDFFGEDFGFNTSTHTLTIPTTTLRQGTPQFDFMYSNITPREPATEGFDPVPMEFKHLFTAFKVTVSDNTQNDVHITLKSVKISRLKNKRSAEIDFNADTKPDIRYRDVASDGTFTFASPSSEPLTSSPLEISNGYHIMWPHTKTDLKGDGTDGSSVIIKVVYDYREDSGYSESDVSKEIDLKNVKELSDWLAGNKYNLGLQFKDKEIILDCNVVDWTPVEEKLDFSNEVNVSQKLTWDKASVDTLAVETGEVVLHSDKDVEAICNFIITAPAGATWTASLISKLGNLDAFTLVDGTKYGAVGVPSTIKIKVNNQVPIAPRHECILRITVRTIDGRTIVVKNLMPPEAGDIEEFTIIQNPIIG